MWTPPPLSRVLFRDVDCGGGGYFFRQTGPTSYLQHHLDQLDSDHFPLSPLSSLPLQTVELLSIHPRDLLDSDKHGNTRHVRNSTSTNPGAGTCAPAGVDAGNGNHGDVLAGNGGNGKNGDGMKGGGGLGGVAFRR